MIKPGLFIDLCFCKFTGHLWEKIESGNMLHRAFSVFLFNSKYELLLQVCSLDKVSGNWNGSLHAFLLWVQTLEPNAASEVLFSYIRYSTPYLQS